MTKFSITHLCLAISLFCGMTFTAAAQSADWVNTAFCPVSAEATYIFTSPDGESMVLGYIPDSSKVNFGSGATLGDSCYVPASLYNANPYFITTYNTSGTLLSATRRCLQSGYQNLPIFRYDATGNQYKGHNTGGYCDGPTGGNEHEFEHAVEIEGPGWSQKFDASCITEELKDFCVNDKGSAWSVFYNNYGSYGGFSSNSGMGAISMNDSAGNLQWVKDFITNSDSIFNLPPEFQHISADPFDSLFFGGYSLFNIALGGDTAGGSTCFLGKADPTGTLAWHKFLPVLSNPHLVAGKDGSVYFSGGFTGDSLELEPGVMIYNPAGGTETYFVQKFRADGTPDWNRTLSGGAPEISTLAVATSGTLYLAGHHTAGAEFAGSSLANAGAEDFFIAALDTAGALLSLMSEGDTGSERINDLAIDNAENLYLTGTFTSASIDFGGIWAGNGNPSNRKIFTVKYSPSGLTNRIKPATSEMKLFPNPVKESLIVQLDHSSSNTYQLEIFDLKGRIIRSHTLSPDSHRLIRVKDLSGISPGVYAIRVQSPSKVWHSRFIKR